MEKVTAEQLKEMAKAMGADLCGIAPVGRFEEAPEGFRPQNIFPETKSVIVLAKRFPEGTFSFQSFVTYTFACEVILREVFRITCELALKLQYLSITAVPIPSEPYEYWDSDAKEGKGILSLRHAGYLAGLGVLGKNTLLTNDIYGNRITLGALLMDMPLREDPEEVFMVVELQPNFLHGASGKVKYHEAFSNG